MTLASDRILDLRDEINSLEFCLSNVELSNYVYIKKEEILKCLEAISDKLILKTSNFKRVLDIYNSKNKNEFEFCINNKITNCMSLALKIEYIKQDLYKLDEIKVSQHVYDFIKNV